MSKISLLSAGSCTPLFLLFDFRPEEDAVRRPPLCVLRFVFFVFVRLPPPADELRLFPCPERVFPDAIIATKSFLTKSTRLL